MHMPLVVNNNVMPSGCYHQEVYSGISSLTDLTRSVVSVQKHCTQTVEYSKAIPGILLKGSCAAEWEDRGTHFQLHAVLPAAPPTPTLEEVTTVQDARADDEARESAHREEVDESLRASAGAAAILPRGPLREEMWLEVEQVVLAPTVWPKESLEIFNAQYAVEVCTHQQA